MTCTNDSTKDLEQVLKNFKGKYYIPNDDDGIDYQQLYERQKHRADELEKRWSELVDVLKKKYEYYKVRADDESAGPIEQDKWKIAKHELMMVLMTMTELQEDDND